MIRNVLCNISRYWPVTLAVIVIAGIWITSFAWRFQSSYDGNLGGGERYVVSISAAEFSLCRWWNPVKYKEKAKIFFGHLDYERGVIRMLPGISFLGFFYHHSARDSATGLGTIFIIPFWAIALPIVCFLFWRRRRKLRLGYTRRSFEVIL